MTILYKANKKNYEKKLLVDPLLMNEIWGDLNKGKNKTTQVNLG
jgi:hypothetical protein